jgi:hypothetical protein
MLKRRLRLVLALRISGENASRVNGRGKLKENLDRSTSAEIHVG